MQTNELPRGIRVTQLLRSGFFVSLACVGCWGHSPAAAPVEQSVAQPANVSDSVAQPVNAKPLSVAHPATGLSEAIRDRVDHLRYARDHDVRGDRIILDEIVAQYYESQQFKPAWQEPARVDALIATLMDVVTDGLDPADYHLDSLQSYRLDLRMRTPLTNEDRADLEFLATDALVLALYHVYGGKVEPLKLSSQWNYSSRPIRSERAYEMLARILATGQVREALDEVRPRHVWYQRGRERLREYRKIAVAGGWPTLPDGPVLKPGMIDPRVPILRKRLEITKDIPAVTMSGAAAVTATQPVGPATPDAPGVSESTAAVIVNPATVYDASLEQGVRNFQERHGLAADGVIGPGTRAALNIPVSARIDQIRVNLERARWTLHEARGEFVLVDVAGFYVSYFRDDQPIWTSRVVVGRGSRETPIFRSMITYVVFNPTWTIPPGILVKDKLPELRRNPGALRRMNIRVLDNSGREVDPYSVNWNSYSSSRLPPYQFRQDAGPDNALGLVKIMFPNQHLVYLHDSPAKSLYELDERAFSSGCIRVEKPF
jgi:murein L,D-transpeptidase YcbB/YkuD